MTERTEELVRSLARDLAPVRRLPTLGRVALALAALAAVLVVVQLGFGVAAGLALVKPDFGSLDLQTLLVHSLLASAALAFALGESVPGRERLARLGAVGVALAFAGLGLVVVERVIGFSGTLADGWLAQTFQCGLGAVVPALIPALVFAAFAARAAPHRAARALVLGAAASIAWLTLPGILRCDFPDALHHVVGHVLAPVIGALALLVLVLPFYLSVRALRSR
jgi:uncharacterized membrane protein